MHLAPLSYSLVIMMKDKIYGVRDPYGNRPLCIGKIVPISLGRRKFSLNTCSLLLYNIFEIIILITQMKVQKMHQPKVWLYQVKVVDFYQLVHVMFVK